jgi:SAM-dependent methyltransferase
MTVKYYNENAKDFIENTINAEMQDQYSFFEKYMKDQGKVLDVGFGSGRDSLYFSKRYEVISIDNSEVFVEEAKKLLNNTILLLDVKEMSFKNEFDGIWACASLLHIPYTDLSRVLNNCYDALKEDGIMYASFKYGEFEGLRHGRYFTDLNEDRLNELIDNTKFTLKELLITNDVRPERDEQWVNIILAKK